MNWQPDTVILYASLLIAASAAILWWLFGRDEKRVPLAVSHPPFGFNPADLGFALDGDISHKDIASLLLYWAEKGYLKLDNSDGCCRAVKCSELGTDAQGYERYLFGELFRYGAVAEPMKLAGIFRPVMNKARRMLARQHTIGRPLFTRASLALKRVYMILTAVPVLSVLILSLYRGMGQLEAAVIAAGVVGTIVLLPVFGMVNLLYRWRGEPGSTRIDHLVRLIIVIALFSLGYLMYARDAFLPALAPVAAACTLISGVCTAFVSKRTADGLNLQCAAEGLRQFIQDPDPSELRRLQQEDPRYFYKMLPYAYVFGLSSQWAARFDSIPVEKPHWLSGYNQYKGRFNPIDLGTAISKAMSSFLYYMVTYNAGRRYFRYGGSLPGGGGSKS